MRRVRVWSPSIYDRTIAVVNTLDSEGFSNTFLEGWA
jgi:hypothetical protein